MDHSLSPGAHLTTPRFGYSHHGIYAGDGLVIHYAGFKRLFRRGPVEQIPLEQFVKGRGLQVRAWVAPKFSGVDVVERARSRLGESRYRLLSNNCEHFSAWCISGASRSAQVDAFKARVLRIFGVRALRALAGGRGPSAAANDAAIGERVAA